MSYEDFYSYIYSFIHEIVTEHNTQRAKNQKYNLFFYMYSSTQHLD